MINSGRLYGRPSLAQQRAAAKEEARNRRELVLGLQASGFSPDEAEEAVRALEGQIWLKRNVLCGGDVFKKHTVGRFKLSMLLPRGKCPIATYSLSVDDSQGKP